MSAWDHGDLFAEIRKIEIVTRHLVNDQLAGQYHSVFKGRGMAFDEVRQYQPGDDVRLIDWNVSARMNEPYVKVFVEERERTVMILVDVSGSTSFGTVRQTKNRLMAKLAAVFAFSAIRNNDRVGLILFSDRIEKFVPPKKGKKHVLRVVSEILRFSPERRATSLAAGLDFFNKVTDRRSVAVLLSDFADSDWETQIRLAASKHDVVPICIDDPAERSLPHLGLVYLEDPETGSTTLVDTEDPRVRGAYEREYKRRRVAREQLFRRHKIDFVTLSTESADLQPLVQFFKRRAKRALRL